MTGSGGQVQNPGLNSKFKIRASTQSVSMLLFFTIWGQIPARPESATPSLPEDSAVERAPVTGAIRRVCYGNRERAHAGRPRAMRGALPEGRVANARSLRRAVKPRRRRPRCARCHRRVSRCWLITKPPRIRTKVFFPLGLEHKCL